MEVLITQKQGQVRISLKGGVIFTNWFRKDKILLNMILKGGWEFCYSGYAFELEEYENMCIEEQNNFAMVYYL